ncbi:MAG: hypothetical protein PVF17_09015 [Ignavibacteria bacterium]|jgi:hypothetical protein
MTAVKIKIVYTLFFFTTLFIACKTNSLVIPDLQGKILCLEDLDGKHGRLDGNFCDIVAYDIKNGSRYVITDDNYYDDHPSYSKQLNTIFFESKRIGAHVFTGLTSASNIFSLNLGTKTIELVDNDSLKTRYKYLIRDDNDHPVLNHSGNKLAFMNYSPNGIGYSRLLVNDLEKDTVYLITDSLDFVVYYTWSSSDSLIIFTETWKNIVKDRRNFIATINLATKEKLIIVDYENSNKTLGDCLGSRLVYIEEVVPSGRKNLMIIDLITFELWEITDLDIFGFDAIREPVFYDKLNVFLICSNYISPDKFDEDIYLLHLQTLELKQITFTHYIKAELSYIR